MKNTWKNIKSAILAILPAHSWQTLLLYARTLSDQNPALQSTQAAEPELTTANFPIIQGWHESLEEAAILLEDVPWGQGAHSDCPDFD